jgi:hypothetical protein
MSRDAKMSSELDSRDILDERLTRLSSQMEAAKEQGVSIEKYNELKKKYENLLDELAKLGKSSIQLVVFLEAPSPDQYNHLQFNKVLIQNKARDKIIPRVRCLDSTGNEILLPLLLDDEEIKKIQPGIMGYANQQGILGIQIDDSGEPVNIPQSRCEMGTLKEILADGRLLIQSANSHQEAVLEPCPVILSKQPLKKDMKIHYLGSWAFHSMEGDDPDIQSLARVPGVLDASGIYGQSARQVIIKFTKQMTTLVEKMHEGTATKRHRVWWILHGRMGNCKTELAKVLASIAATTAGVEQEKVLYIYKAGSDIIDPFVGISGQNIKEAFSQLDKKAGKYNVSIGIFEELDALAPSGSDNHSEIVRNSTTNVLQTYMEGIDDLHPGIVLIGTMNRLHDGKDEFLDRFNYAVEIKPGFDEVKPWLRGLLEDECTTGFTDFDTMADRFIDFLQRQKLGRILYRHKEAWEFNSLDFINGRDFQRMVLGAIDKAEEADRPLLLRDLIESSVDYIEHNKKHKPYHDRSGSNIRNYFDIVKEDYEQVTGIEFYRKTLSDYAEYMDESEFVEEI